MRYKYHVSGIDFLFYDTFLLLSRTLRHEFYQEIRRRKTFYSLSFHQRSLLNANMHLSFFLNFVYDCFQCLIDPSLNNNSLEQLVNQR